jgi:hypothetical protein
MAAAVLRSEIKLKSTRQLLSLRFTMRGRRLHMRCNARWYRDDNARCVDANLHRAACSLIERLMPRALVVRVGRHATEDKGRRGMRMVQCSEAGGRDRRMVLVVRVRR